MAASLWAQAHTWSGAAPPVVGNGSTVTIAAGASGTLIIPENATVAIVSSGTAAVDNGTRAITLNIGQNATVAWSADYAASTVNVSGIGTLSVVDGSIISSSNGISTTTNSTITVSGGVVSAAGSFRAINSTGASGTVTISGGVVRAAAAQAINAAGTLNITGGLVIAQRADAIGISGVVNKEPAVSGTGTGTIVGYTLGGSHTGGSTTGLVFLPAAAPVSWGLRDDWETGISYSGGFFSLSGVSVDDRVVWNSSVVPATVGDKAVVTIAEGASGTLPVSANAAAVMIVSQNTGVVDNGSRSVTLNIGAGAKVAWKANYTSACNAAAGAVIVSGTGTLEVDGGSISNTATGTGDNTIYTTSNSTVIVSGGAVSGERGRTIRSTGASATVTVSGGVVSATTGQAIEVSAGAAFRVTGGLVIAQRSAVTGTSGTVSRDANTISGNGTIIAYTLGTHALGSTTGLVFGPSAAAVSWGLSGGQAGINYPESGFYRVDGVTIASTVTAYTVTYHTNGGTGTEPADQTVNVGNSVTLASGSGFTRSGFTFDGWNTAAAGTGINYDAGTIFTPTADITLYARWVSIASPAYTVIYHTNGGTGTVPAAQVVNVGSSVTLASGSGFTRSGFTFDGWNTSTAGTGTNYTAGAAFTPTANITLYARWVPVTSPAYTVIYHTNGGTGTAPATQSVNAGSSITLASGSELARSGFTFDGWNTSTAGTGTNYTAGAIFTPTANTILYARWNPIISPDYTVTYHINGGTGTVPAAQTVNAGSSVTLASGSGLTRSGFTFDGWNTSTDGTGTDYNAGAVFTSTADITLYAKWTSTAYTVTYSINGGTGTVPAVQSVNIGSSVTLAGGNGFTRSGFTFGGWNTSTAGTGTNYSAGAAFTPTANIVLYARWNSVAVRTFYEQVAAYATATGNVVVTVNQNLTLSEPVNIPSPVAAGRTLTIRSTPLSAPVILTRDVGDNLFTLSTNATLILENIIIDGNFDGTQYKNGNSLVRVSDGGTLVMNNGAVVRNNSRYDQYGVGIGGSVSVYGGTFIMTGGEIRDNASWPADGGSGVFVSGGTFTMTGGRISGDAFYGVYLSFGEFTMAGGEISGNNTSRLVGGGVYLGDGTFTMTGGKISNNTAHSFSNVPVGGAVSVRSGTFTMTNGEISNNTGVGVSVHEGTFIMDGGEISDNNNHTGGVYVGGGTFTMTNGKISGNAAAGVNISGGTFTMADGEITGNNHGGVHVSDGGTFAMNEGEISGNTVFGVVVGGGGIFTMTNGKISGTVLDGSGYSSGSGIVVDNNGTFEMTGGEISGNTSFGGGVVSNGIFNMAGGKISNNGGVFGGGVSVGGGTFTMTGGEISDNSAEWSAAVRIDGGIFSMVGGKISRNSSQHGGSVWVNGAFTMAGGEISGNISGSHGTGVSVVSGSTFTMAGGVVSGTGRTADGIISGSYTLNTAPAPATNNGIIIAWDKPDGAGPFVYAESESTHLIVFPAASATAVWAIEGGKSGISYKNGANTGFIEAAGVALGPDALVPNVAAEFQNISVVKGGHVKLSIAASSPDGGILSYQWFSSASASNSGGTAISGATGTSYDVATNVAGTFYYYVVVTNTNTVVNGIQTAVFTSHTATVTVIDAPISIASGDRVIPPNDTGDESAIIAPVKVLTATFTAGPNPVSKSFGKVTFYRQGKPVRSAALTIFDISGNVINRININEDKGVEHSALMDGSVESRRVAGSWDLTDRRGNRVSEGTYLVRGVVTTVDGKRERVSLIVGVR